MQKLAAQADCYIADLEARLRITESQSEAWAAFVDTLQANRERMQSAACESAPFGATADRLAALGAMRRVLRAFTSTSMRHSGKPQVGFCRFAASPLSCLSRPLWPCGSQFFAQFSACGT